MTALANSAEGQKDAVFILVATWEEIFGQY